MDENNLMENQKQIMDQETITRKVIRISHEIVEKNQAVEDLVLIGIRNRGAPLSMRIRDKIMEITNIELPLGSLDITFHRDDFRERLVIPQIKGTDIDFSLDGKVVILIDDVLYTGRTIRAALDELNSFGRPSAVQLAVLVDRGHRELPIRADFVGKNIPTHEGEHVAVRLQESDDREGVFLIRVSD